MLFTIEFTSSAAANHALANYDCWPLVGTDNSIVTRDASLCELANIIDVGVTMDNSDVEV